jgi:hypothetical protein
MQETLLFVNINYIPHHNGIFKLLKEKVYKNSEILKIVYV